MNNTKKMVLAALFAALVCVSTMIIRIPTPGTGGYIHLGDAMVILCGVYLGPVAGFLAAGIGSTLTDILGGYFIYAPITFVIKGLVAFFTAIAYRNIVKKVGQRKYIGVLAGGVIDILLVAVGYLLFESVIYGFAGAVVSVIPNVIQGVSGLIISVVLFGALSAVPEFQRMSSVTKKSV